MVIFIVINVSSSSVSGSYSRENRIWGYRVGNRFSLGM